MDKALEYLRIIHEAVLTLHYEGITDLVELTKRTTIILALPPQAVNLLLTTTLSANLQISDHKNLLEIVKRKER